jgi:hypothetical protein
MRDPSYSVPYHLCNNTWFITQEPLPTATFMVWAKGSRQWFPMSMCRNTPQRSSCVHAWTHEQTVPWQRDKACEKHIMQLINLHAYATMIGIMCGEILHCSCRNHVTDDGIQWGTASYVELGHVFFKREREREREIWVMYTVRCKYIKWKDSCRKWTGSPVMDVDHSLTGHADVPDRGADVMLHKDMQTC